MGHNQWHDVVSLQARSLGTNYLIKGLLTYAV